MKKNISIYDVAKQSGFSPSTVSKVLNNSGRISEKTRQKVHETAKEMNFIVDYNAKALSSKKRWLIGVIYGDNMGIGFSHPFFAPILQNFKNTVEEQGYEITFVNKKLAKNDMTYLEFCKHRKVDGVFVVTFDNHDEDLKELVESDIPVVFADSGNFDVTNVVSNDLEGGRLAANYMLTCGHSYVGHIAGPLYAKSSQLRLQGFEEVMKENGIDKYLVIVSEDFTYEGGYNQALRIVRRERKPSAIFVATDWMALGAIKAFHENGIKVPEDISVIGYDNIEFLKYSTPALTTISQNVEEIGKEVAQSLIGLINGEVVASKKLNVSLIERETMKKIK